jgi:filamentous hemagglutinin family protein
MKTFKSTCFAPLTVFLSSFLSFISPTTAQILPDRSLPNNSAIDRNGDLIKIDGGTTSGRNLFHSFERFSVGDGQTAHFNNASNIQNIFSRVTGSSISNIDGILRANGTANVFFLNPNGIIFGENARLDIGGSFLGTTADSIVFADGFEFSASDTDAPPLLTVEVPIGLGFGSNPGSIEVRDRGHQLIADFLGSSPTSDINNPQGLQAQQEKTIALVGGEIIFEGGIVSANNGQIEIGAVNSGSVALTQNDRGWTFNYEKISAFQDIRLSQQSLVEAYGDKRNTIQIQGRNLSLTDGSIVFLQNQGIFSDNILTVRASDLIGISGLNSNRTVASSFRTENINSGEGGDIFLSTRQLLLEEWGGIGTVTYNLGNAGNLNLNALENITLTGVLTQVPSVAIYSLANGQGQGGNIYLSTRNLNLTQLGFVGTTAGAGKGGNVEVSTQNLLISNGSNVGSATFGEEDAGNISINASDSIELIGSSPSSVISSSTIQANRFPQVISGNSGNVIINTPKINITDGASITVRNDGTGNAGSLSINAPSITLDNTASITAATASGEGGNITIDSSDIRLNNQSTITATAGGTGNGGDVTINTDTLAALDNSDITANAFRGNGGNILINAQGVFFAPDSDVTATSQLGIDGTVTINTPDSDVRRDLEAQPTSELNTEEIIASSCLSQQNAQRGSFVNTGNGSLPISPDSAVSEFSVDDNDSPPPPLTTPQRSPQTLPPPLNHNEQIWITSVPAWKPGDPIVRGNKIIITPDGDRILVASATSDKVEGAQYLVCPGQDGDR